MASDDTKNTNRDQFIAELVTEHGVPLEKYLARKLGNPEDAAELAQEAFIRLHRLEKPETLDNSRAFLYQVATNLAVDQLRRRQLHYKYLKSEKGIVEDGELQDPNAAGVSPEQIISAREKLAAIEGAVEELPFKVKQAFLLHRQSGMPYSAIAEQLQVSVSSVEKYILQALKHCRRRLASHYLHEDRQ
ncbi:hypothetical protein A3709_01705 [Halioglobus sp. HI00S01]|uniref:RNA polymerase sigma factor n=1 Tax=Halioglobus sp. HI00S01 TaxID=1822214 RepID=UPI0007C2906E|nr:RNA polymerase sigma factor [Halioglobus sp. HI00S01]KZX58209.1 hypothetical protein A3709_01705 [Halioglobus sp. HI00S01]